MLAVAKLNAASARMKHQDMTWNEAYAWVSEHFTTRIVGLPEDESQALLDELFAHSTQAALQYRHQWQPHDLVFWDNRSVTHLAAGTPDHLPRKLYRTTIEEGLYEPSADYTKMAL
jgi:alpha-ketoglutarate-dependent taurine dioxygenase